MDETSSESNIIRTYLDWLVNIPYGVIQSFFYFNKNIIYKNNKKNIFQKK